MILNVYSPILIDGCLVQLLSVRFSPAAETHRQILLRERESVLELSLWILSPRNSESYSRREGRKIVGVRGNQVQQENMSHWTNKARITWAHRDCLASKPGACMGPHQVPCI